MNMFFSRNSRAFWMRSAKVSFDLRIVSPVCHARHPDTVGIAPAFTLFKGILQLVVPHAKLSVKRADAIQFHRVSFRHAQCQFLTDQRQHTKDAALLHVSLACTQTHEFIKVHGRQLHFVVSLRPTGSVQVRNFLFYILCMHNLTRLLLQR